MNEDQCRQIEKMLRVRRLELRGATEGERTAATEALGRLLTAYGATEPTQARTELDAIQARLDRAPPGAKLVPHPPQPVVQVWVVRSSASTTTTTTATDTSTGGFYW